MKVPDAELDIREVVGVVDGSEVDAGLLDVPRADEGAVLVELERCRLKRRQILSSGDVVPPGAGMVVGRSSRTFGDGGNSRRAAAIS